MEALQVVAFVYVVLGSVFVLDYVFDTDPRYVRLPGIICRFFLWPLRLLRYAIENWRDL
jgi:hypothetical protein